MTFPLRFVIGVIAAACVLAITVTDTWAQTATEAGTVVLDAAVDAGASVVRTKAEEAAGRVFTQDQIDLIKIVLGKTQDPDAGTTPSTTNTPSNQVDELDEASKDKKKEKKNKAKNKSKSNELPPGLAKKNDLPPGLQKKLDRGEPLPPGLAKRGLPTNLERDLGPPAQNTERVIVDNDVVLVEKGTQVILDVLHDVLGSSGS